MEIHMLASRGAKALRGRDERYPASIILGVMTIVLLLAAGAAVDYARVVNMRDGLETAIESASLAIRRAIHDGELSDGEIEAIAMSGFDKNVASARLVGTTEVPSVMIDRTTSTITVRAKGTVAMTITRLGGIDVVTVPAMSKVSFPPGPPVPQKLGPARSLAYSGGW